MGCSSIAIAHISIHHNQYIRGTDKNQDNSRELIPHEWNGKAKRHHRRRTSYNNVKTIARRATFIFCSSDVMPIRAEFDLKTERFFVKSRRK